jgi:poly(A) polymerase Pap1
VSTVPRAPCTLHPAHDYCDTRRLFLSTNTELVGFLIVNSSYNVGVPQLRRIKMEMTSASLLLERNVGSWRQLLDGSDFFTKHSNFLQITIRADNYEEFLKWQRLCESRLRILLGNLETPQISAWPFAKFFRRKYSPAGVVAVNNMISNCDCLHESLFFVALRFSPGVDSVNLRYCTSDFLHNVNSWEERKKGMDLNIAHIIQSELPDFVHNDTVRCDDNLSGPTPAEMKENKKNLKTPSKAVSEVTGETGTTRLTPKLARSTVSDALLGTPQKRQRSGL